MSAVADFLNEAAEVVEFSDEEAPFNGSPSPEAMVLISELILNRAKYAAHAFKVLKHRENAEDVLQNTYLNISRVKSFEGNVSAYLYKTITNAALKFNTSKAAQEKLQSSLYENADVVLHSKDSDEIVITTYQHSLLKVAVMNLPAKQKAVIAAVLGGSTLRQYSVTHKANIETVRVHYKLGLQRVKEIIQTLEVSKCI